jgi:hypothetical protein
MKKVTMLCGLLLALSATIASASGVGLKWDLCAADGGMTNKAFACNTNAGSNQLVGTFALNAAGLAQVSGNEVIIDLASAGATLPAWWQMFKAGTCRNTSLTMNFVANGAAVNCADWALGASAGGIGAYNIGQRGPNTSRIIAAIAVPPSALADLAGGQEYFSFNVLINHLKTVGTGLCDGCQTPVCIVFNSINLTTPILANNVKLSGPENGTDSDFVTWQGGAGVVVNPPPPGSPPVSGCPAATPTKNATWSQVKSMYR